jgi:Uma2 family endonuclease
MSELVELENEVKKMGSLNHSLAQAQITGSLINDKRFTVMIELSLDASQMDLSQFDLKVKEELKPDICLYPNTVWFSESTDILKMSDMPLLIIEILSPKQGIDDILAKFKAYFALGVKSCWLVTPALRTITIYSQINNFRSYDIHRDTELVDELLDIRLPLQKIFNRYSNG